MIDKNAPPSEQLGMSRHIQWEDKRTQEIENLKLEIKMRDMVIDYMYRISCMMHPSQLIVWAKKAIEQGVDLEHVRTD